LFLLVAFAFPVQGQSPAATSDSASHFFAPVTTISKVVDEVALAFTVTDKKGHFIGNLRQNDFTLFDNNEAPRRLTFFQQRS